MGLTWCNTVIIYMFCSSNSLHTVAMASRYPNFAILLPVLCITCYEVRNNECVNWHNCGALAQMIKSGIFIGSTWLVAFGSSVLCVSVALSESIHCTGLLC